MADFRENQDFFDRSRHAIVGAAPDGAQHVVIANSTVVGYFDQFEEALEVWATHEDAVVASLVEQPSLLIASNFMASDQPA